MEPTTRPAWKHWAATLALLAFAGIIAPLIASLPLAAAYAIASALVVIILIITRRLGRARP